MNNEKEIKFNCGDILYCISCNPLPILYIPHTITYIKMVYNKIFYGVIEPTQTIDYFKQVSQDDIDLLINDESLKKDCLWFNDKNRALHWYNYLLGKICAESIKRAEDILKINADK